MKIRLGMKWGMSKFIIDNYYIWVFALYFITLLRLNFQVGVYAALIMMLIGGMLFFIGVFQNQVYAIDLLVLAYLFYCCSSVIWVILNGINLDAYIRAVSNSLFPILFYYCARMNRWTFYKRFLCGYHVCSIIGFSLLVTMPAWYYQYCRNYGYPFTRLSSFIGSTAVGSLGAVAVLVSIWIVYESRGKKGKISYLLSIIFVFASMQRSAWIVATASLVFTHFYVFFVWKTVKCRYLLVELAGLALAGFVMRNRIISMVQRWILEHQVAGSQGMFSERTGQWVQGIKNANLLYGNGYGTVGHKAIGYVEAIVADGSWICLLCEIGIIGVTIFLMILIWSVKHGLSHLKELFLPLGIIVCISLQAIGSNMFEYQIIMPVFWYAIGCIAYHDRKQKEVLKNANISNVSPTVP